MNAPMLSIIIPTKNRYDYLFPAIRSLLKYLPCSGVEIIIQDNSDSNAKALQQVDVLNDSRVKYAYTPEPISLMENTNKAIQASSGEYAVFIGDDDFVSPKILSFVSLMKERDILCLTYNCGFYWWKDVEFKNPNYYHHKEALCIPKGITQELRKKSSRRSLPNVLLSGATHFYDLPRFYHGIVKRTVLEQLKARYGKFLVGGCPDMAFSIALALELDEYYYVNYPITLYGGSPKSGAGLVINKNHYGRIEDQPFLPKSTVENWDPNIVRFWTANTIYAQTTYEILCASGSDMKINYIPHYASVFANESGLRRYVWPKLVSYSEFNILRYGQFCAYLVKKFAGKWSWSARLSLRRLPYRVYTAPTPDNVLEYLESI